MWKAAERKGISAVFAPLSLVAGTNPTCAACDKPLAPKGRATRHSPQIISFWLIRCTCRQAHIIWNDAAISQLPPPADVATPTSRSEKDAPGQSNLIDFTKLLKKPDQ